MPKSGRRIRTNYVDFRVRNQQTRAIFRSHENNRLALWLIVFLVVLAPMFSWSCHVDIQLQPGVPPTVGAIGIIIVTITQTHNPCLIAIEKTKIKATGFIIIGATRWKESKPQVFIENTR